MERDGKSGSVRQTGVACQSLFPGKAPMRASGASQNVLRGRSDRGGLGRACQAYSLATDHFQPFSPDATAGPILPQHWSTRQWHECVGGRGGNSRGRGGEQPIYCTHPSRFDRGTVFLTLSTQRAAATMTDTSSVQDPQGTISLRTPFLWIERVISRTTQCPISLRGKSGARKAMGKGRTCPLGRP
jgi:hypothetical protein